MRQMAKETHIKTDKNPLPDRVLGSYPNSAIIISHCQCQKSWLLPSFSLGPKLNECGAFLGPNFVKCYHKVAGFLSWKWYLMAPNSPVILHVDDEQDTLKIVKLAL
jgi:hypothetical protein